MVYRILVLGAYGTFGSRIVRRLSELPDLHLFLAGRSPDKITSLINKLASPKHHAILEAVPIDINDADQLAITLRTVRCALVINTCGPFQKRHYTIPMTVIKQGVHYIDLADARDYVCGFTKLDELAKRYQVLAITGASSVPALSAAVIDQLQNDFSMLMSIDMGINPGNKTPRGLATVRSILSYCGRPFLVFRNRRWRNVTGWQGLKHFRYPEPMGTRWLSYCEVPDLTLFQHRYRNVRTIEFRAGLELSVLHLGTWLLSWLVRWKLIGGADRFAIGLKRISEWFLGFGTQTGGMHVQVEGISKHNRAIRKTWFLVAQDGDGPQVPCTAAVILADLFARGALKQTGACACMGLIDKATFDLELARFNIRQELVSEPIDILRETGWRERLAFNSTRVSAEKQDVRILNDS